MIFNHHHHHQHYHVRDDKNCSNESEIKLLKIYVIKRNKISELYTL